MKASNKNLVLGTPTEINNSIRVEQVQDISKHTAIINLLPFFSMLIAILPGIIRRSSSIEIVKIGILTLILTAAASFFIRMNAVSILNKRLAKSIISISYLVSISLLMLIRNPEIFSFWMIGGLLVAMLIDSKLGLLLHFNLTFILGISLSLRLESMIYLLIIGILMSLLASSLKQKATVIYAAIILLSTNITLAFVINNFIIDSSTNYNYLSSFFCIFAVLITAFLLCLLYERFTLKLIVNEKIVTTEEIENHSETKDSSFSDNEDDMNSSEIVSPLDEGTFAESEVASHNHFGTRTSYEVLNEEGNALLNKLNNFSKNLYEHAIQIGDISFRAAKEIGADENLAKAGGLYHEIGKINGKNYIDEGMKIAEEYTFPKELTLILKQHNIKFDKPTSVEATIVMLSDNVVSTIEYIEKTDDLKFTTNKIIDNIFQMRMEKGTFDNSGLSVKDFKQLKEFYQKEFNNKELSTKNYQ